MVRAIEVFLIVLLRTWFYAQYLIDFSESCASGCGPTMNPADMEDAFLQAREGLNQETAGLPCKERVDPGVKKSGGQH